MRITLIGMSSSGKTYWSKKLEKAGFLRFGCDDIIESKLESELKRLGYSGINDVAKWMGQPYENQYPETSTKYLEFEIESLRYIIQKLQESISLNENVVVDTTGSVIYTGRKILDKLRQLTNVIYLETPKSVQQEMYKSYLGNPKPVIWGNSFRMNGEKSGMAALTKCYPNLLSYRTKKYQKLAHLRLNYYLLRALDFQLENFLALLDSQKAT